MSWFTSILTSTYRYTVQLFNLGGAPIPTLGKAISIDVEFENPQAVYNVNFENPQALTDVNFENPQATYNVDFPDTGVDGT